MLNSKVVVLNCFAKKMLPSARAIRVTIHSASTIPRLHPRLLESALDEKRNIYDTHTFSPYPAPKDVQHNYTRYNRSCGARLGSGGCDFSIFQNVVICPVTVDRLYGFQIAHAWGAMFASLNKGSPVGRSVISLINLLIREVGHTMLVNWGTEGVVVPLNHAFSKVTGKLELTIKSFLGHKDISHAMHIVWCRLVKYDWWTWGVQQVNTAPPSIWPFLSMPQVRKLSIVIIALGADLGERNRVESFCSLRVVLTAQGLNISSFQIERMVQQVTPYGKRLVVAAHAVCVVRVPLQNKICPERNEH
ncbi:hypothetical protein EDC04DRAFT_3095361 [Pisolithus marmoratus]|nr:hypothetical protein EDC04DRAFT_3095361 [Pisolithus marmoratus]